MPSQVRSPSSFTNIPTTGSDGSYSSPANMYSSNNARSGFGNTSGSTSLRSNITSLYNFGFDIPAGATIDGIQIRVEQRYQGTGSRVSYRIYLLTTYNADTYITIVANESDSNLTTSDAVYNYGDSSDLHSHSWSAADINSSNFNVAFEVTSSRGLRHEVDDVEVEVWYTLPPADKDLEGYRWYADDADPSGSPTALASQDTAAEFNRDTAAVLRMLLDLDGIEATFGVRVSVKKSGDPDSEYRVIGTGP